ncbi:MAG: hypothetical protein IKI88_05215 [Anaerotignum sp.]|nr:hypothetical protein [Anaerotignum sp.]
MGTKNKVIAGDYSGANIMPVAGKVVLSISLGNMIILNKKTVAAHEIVSETQGKHRVSIQFVDGKKSLLELDDKLFQMLIRDLF